jgi:predicted negative regulator of RcsB-dependent stress response
METYLTEEERLEALQRWWKESKSSLIVGVVMGLLIITGWKYWQGHQQAQREEASLTYHLMGRAISAKQPEEAVKMGQQLIESHPSTTYAEFARLTLAKLKVEAGDLEAAKLRLEEEVKQGHDETLKELARLRLARILLARGEADAGLALLKGTESSAGKFSALFEEVRGDLLNAAQRTEEARTAYQKAKEQGNRSPLLDLKIHDLPAAG